MSTQTLTIVTTETQTFQTTNIVPTRAPENDDALNYTKRLRRRTAVGGFSNPPLILPLMLLAMCCYRQIPFWDRFLFRGVSLLLPLPREPIPVRQQRPASSPPEATEKEFPGHPDSITVNQESWYPKCMMLDLPFDNAPRIFPRCWRIMEVHAAFRQ